MHLADIIDLQRHDITSGEFCNICRNRLDGEGVLALADFLTPSALEALQREARAAHSRAYFCEQAHTVYLSPKDKGFGDDHARNRDVLSSKGCICDDDVAADSVLRILYDAADFRAFVMAVTGETALHPYADPLSSINIHYAEREQELGWHFDNSQFAITLLIQKPEAGSHFEYVRDLRDAEAGEMAYERVGALLDGAVEPQVLAMEPGALILFRGRNSIHRVSPNESDTVRMLAVLAYNAQPGIELSKNARMTFYGRLD